MEKIVLIDELGRMKDGEVCDHYLSIWATVAIAEKRNYYLIKNTPFYLNCYGYKAKLSDINIKDILGVVSVDYEDVDAILKIWKSERN